MSENDIAVSINFRDKYIGFVIFRLGSVLQVNDLVLTYSLGVATYKYFNISLLDICKPTRLQDETRIGKMTMI